MLMQNSKDDEGLSWVLLAGMIEQSKKAPKKLVPVCGLSNKCK